MSTSNPYNELETIREASQLLATRFSMLAAPLTEATETFWSVIHNDDVGEWPETVRTKTAELADDLTAEGDVTERVSELDGFEADGLIGRILDLRKEMQESCTHEVA